MNKTIVIGLHGLFGSYNSEKQMAVGLKCAENGIDFKSIDWTCGESMEQIVTSGSYDKYLQNATAQIQSISNGRPTGLFGISYGASLSVSAALLCTNVKALVVISMPISKDSLNTDNLHIDISNQTMPDLSLLANKVKNVLIWHSENDELVKFESAKRFFSLASESKKLRRYEGQHKIELSEFNKLLDPSIAWLRKYLNE